MLRIQQFLAETDPTVQFDMEPDLDPTVQYN